MSHYSELLELGIPLEKLKGCNILVTGGNGLIASSFDETSYATNLEKFLEDKGCVEDGHAAERAVDLIYRILNGDESSTLIGK